MSALFNFQSLLSVVLLIVCTCTYLRSLFPSFIDRNKSGMLGLAMFEQPTSNSEMDGVSFPRKKSSTENLC
ncbi:hypothetical protein AND_009822 [Anopheles darlingi]|uniref:Protein kish n=1 Tax=Anopheles darlingi TaxID=43151 RepID=W5J437_ANODA|nr:hypothetical protein AND_009822 [Anopheles darlingi]